MRRDDFIKIIIKSRFLHLKLYSFSMSIGNKVYALIMLFYSLKEIQSVIMNLN